MHEGHPHVGDVINKELLEILNCQLNRLQLVESNKIGETRLVLKVEGRGDTQDVPAQAHHSALLGLQDIVTDADYQTCLHPIKLKATEFQGRIFYLGLTIFLSVIQFIEKYGGKATVVSYDLMKAYDRVHLGFLYKVMEAMNFGYGQKKEYYDKQAENTMKKITAKALYQLNTKTFTLPAIVFKRLLDLSLAWDRVGYVMVEPKGREMLYMIVNNLFPTQERSWKDCGN